MVNRGSFSWQKGPVLKIRADLANPKEQLVKIDIPSDLIKTGINEIVMTTLQGGWLAFDQVKLEGPAQATLADPGKVLLRNVKAADYEVNVDGNVVQPLLVDVTQLRGQPILEVKLDGQLILTEKIEQDRYTLEAPMPAVSQPVSGTFEIFADKKLISSGRGRPRQEEAPNASWLRQYHARGRTFEMDDRAGALDAFWNGQIKSR
jgi:hypothetical protein